MNKAEFRNHEMYKECMNRIKLYKNGFTFTIPFYKMASGQKNGMLIVLRDCMKEGLIESISISLDLQGNMTEETFKRL